MSKVIRKPESKHEVLSSIFTSLADQSQIMWNSFNEVSSYHKDQSDLSDSDMLELKMLWASVLTIDNILEDLAQAGAEYDDLLEPIICNHRGWDVGVNGVEL